MKQIILASSSPRRIEMMKQHGYMPFIKPADVDEILPMDMTPEASVMYLAFKKASYVSARLETDDNDAIIIAADTIVVHGGKIIGKPKNPVDAFLILSRLRSTIHHVITGVCILEAQTNTKICFADTTAVHFTNYSDEQLDAYVNTSEPYDKAGGYAIQGTFSQYIDHIEGDFDNVVGFPWYRVEPHLKGLL